MMTVAIPGCARKASCSTATAAGTQTQPTAAAKTRQPAADPLRARLAARLRVAAAVVGLTAAATPFTAHADSFCPSATNLVFNSDFSGDWIRKFGKGRRPTFEGGSYWERVRVGADTCLRVHYREGAAGAQNGMWFAQSLYPADRYRLEFSFRLKPGFMYNHTGKLFGLRGGTTTAGTVPTGNDGFSSRATWDNRGRSVAYLYHPDQYMWGGYGDTFPFGSIPSGVLHTIRQELVLNTPGYRNGHAYYWLNGALQLQKTNMRFRNTTSLKIDRLTLDSFFGGSAPNHGSLRDEYIDFCRVRVCKL